MRTAVQTLLSLLVLSACVPAHAQRPTRVQRGTNFQRVTTVRRDAAGVAAPARGIGPHVETDSRDSDSFDPLRPYTSLPAAVPGTPGAYGPPPRDERRPLPGRAAQHTYFPSMRVGQGPNRNVGGGRCSGSRAGMIAPSGMRMGMGMRLAPPLPTPSLGMPNR